VPIINKLSRPTNYGRLQRLNTKNTSIRFKVVQAMKAHRGSRGIAPFILILGARWM
jgi:hypothetical protein